MEMTSEEIKQYLPHRYPFLFIDRVSVLEPGSHIVCHKNVSNNEWMFNGHFPQKAIFPGVLTVEAMAQACGLLGFKTLASDDETKIPDNSIYIFVGIDKLRFRRPIYPGDVIDLYSKVLQNKRNMWRFECSAKVGNELCTQAVILCAHQQV